MVKYARGHSRVGWDSLSTEDTLLLIFVAFLAAKVGGEIMERLRLPAVTGELMAGIVLGPSILNIITEDQTFFDVLAQLGATFLLFSVGMETKLSELKRVGMVATSVAVLGVVVPFVLGYYVSVLLFMSSVEAMFVGAALVATSVGITARVLQDLGMINSTEAKIILGAAVVDDIIGMIVLTVVSGTATGSLETFDIVIVVAEALCFLAIVTILGTRMVRYASGKREIRGDRMANGGWAIHYRTTAFKRDSWFDRLVQKEAPFVIILVVVFGLSAMASYVGLAAIIGAFFAGLIFSDTKDTYELEQKFEPLNVLLVPFFFVVMGAKVGFANLWEVVPIAIVLTVVAILSKLVGCSLGAARRGERTALIVGAGMIPRGEVGIVVAMIGLNMGTIGPNIYSAIVLVSIATTLYAPFLIKTVIKAESKKGRPPRASFN
ncbi:MAG: Na Exchanger protein [Candidatus Thermoplasmatota archaeon]|nr:Na Exchanger protein [Candidatus Thermoplasmatota archaeon]